MKIYNLLKEKSLMFENKNAIKEGVNKMSYAELFAFSEQIKKSILAKLADKSDEANSIALFFDHSINGIASILGVIGTGSSYVPIDTDLPKDRLFSILKDSNINIILYDANTADYLDEMLGDNILDYSLINVESLTNSETDQDLSSEQKNDNEDSPFSILYTSGSTGVPKGVIQTEQNVLFLVQQFIDKLQIDNKDRISLITQLNHTVSIIDIFAALLSGAELLLYNIKSKGISIKDVVNWIMDEKVTILHTVPSLYRYIGNNRGNVKFDDVRCLILGGEQVLKSDFDIYKRCFSDNCKFVNLFGSSELLIASMNILDKNTEIEENVISIGKLYDGLKLSLLDENKKEVANSEVGEMVYESQYIMKGYTNQNNGSIEKLNSGNSIYYSGDLAKYLPNGDIQFLGRKDFQIKINGIRIELSDIESVVEKSENVKKCVVHSFTDENDALILSAYVITNDNSEINESLLKQELKMQLPDYMIPAYFVKVEDFPLTSSGKIDKLQLVDPRTINQTIGNKGDEEFNELEATILAIWQDVLKVDDIGLDDEFLKLGGDSIKMIMLSAKLKEFFGDEVSDTIIFEHPTIRLLAIALESMFAQKILESEG